MIIVMDFLEERDTPWLVEYTNKVRKRKDKLPPEIRDIFYILKGELEQEGPEKTDWRNYGLIVNAKDARHCHLKNSTSKILFIVIGNSSQRAICLRDSVHELMRQLDKLLH